MDLLYGCVFHEAKATAKQEITTHLEAEKRETAPLQKHTVMKIAHAKIKGMRFEALFSS